MNYNTRLGGGSRMFNPRRHTLHDDGLLTIKACGYEEDSEHWTGWLTAAPTEADYDFWYWLACIKQVPGIIHENELVAWKSEYISSQKELVETAAA